MKNIIPGTALINILVCPKCHFSLKQENKKFFCKKCNSSFGIEEEIPKLVVKKTEDDADAENYYNGIYREAVKVNELKTVKKNLPFKSIREEITEKVVRGYKKKGILLSIGCGIGEYEDLFRGEYALLGTDLSLNALKVAKEYCKECQYFQANAESLPLKDQSIDILLCIDMIEHVLDDKAVLKEISRVLKKDGILILTTAFSHQYKNVQVSEVSFRTFRNDSFGEGGDLRDYGYELISQLKELGFSTEKIRFFGGDIMNNLNKIKNYFLNFRKHNRIDVISGRVLAENPHYLIYSKILKTFYWLDYLIYRKKDGTIIFLACRKIK